MAYSKHSFNSGDVLHAAELNEIDDQIFKNESDITEIKQSIEDLDAEHIVYWQENNESSSDSSTSHTVQTNIGLSVVNGLICVEYEGQTSTETKPILLNETGTEIISKLQLLNGKQTAIAAALNTLIEAVAGLSIGSGGSGDSSGGDSSVVTCESVTLNKTTFSGGVGDTVDLVATLSPTETTQTVSWTTSNSNLATVSNGHVSLLGEGSVTITAKCGTKSASCVITIEAASSIYTFNEAMFDVYPSSSDKKFNLITKGTNYYLSKGWVLGTFTYLIPLQAGKTATVKCSDNYYTSIEAKYLNVTAFNSNYITMNGDIPTMTQAYKDYAASMIESAAGSANYPGPVDNARDDSDYEFFKSYTNTTTYQNNLAQITIGPKETSGYIAIYFRTTGVNSSNIAEKKATAVASISVEVK